MSSIKVALQFLVWFAIFALIPKLLAIFVGTEMSIYISVGVAGLFFFSVALFSKYLSKQGHKNTRILPVSHDIPDAVREITDELEDFGFRQIGMIHNKPLGISFGQTIAYVYSNKSQNIIAYAYKTGNIKLTVSCSFPDGLDISTDYPVGPTSGDSDKAIRRIVKTSVQSALDFHRHHVKGHIAEHGKPQKFANLQELLDWEDRHEIAANTSKLMNKKSNKVMLRAIIAMFVAIIVSVAILVPLMIYIAFLDMEEVPLILNLAFPFVSFGSIIIGQLWAAKPVYQQETVEDRKKKEFA